MSSVVVRQETLSLVDEAKSNGASMLKITPIIGFSTRTIKRWRVARDSEDKRTTHKKHKPSNKLTQEEREAVIITANAKEYKNLSPHQIEPNQVTLHSDNGSPMKGATFLTTLQKLGVMPSFSRPSVSDDNPYSESLFKTLKYTPMYPTKPFEDIVSARLWCSKFVEWYNGSHCHSGINYVTPLQRHMEEDKQLLDKRKIVYEKAKSNNPQRWSGKTRNWSFINEVHLNPGKVKKNDKKDILTADII